MTIKPAFEMPAIAPAPTAAPAPPPAAPGPRPPGVPMDMLVDKFRQLRDKKKEIEARHATELKPFGEAMKQLETLMLDALNNAGANSVQTNSGTAFKSTRTSYTVEDPEAFRTWVEANSRPDFYENRASKEAIENWISEGKPMPAGLKVSSIVTLNVRK